MIAHLLSFKFINEKKCLQKNEVEAFENDELIFPTASFPV
jgi:hypothetical protein